MVKYDAQLNTKVFNRICENMGVLVETFSDTNRIAAGNWEKI